MNNDLLRNDTSVPDKMAMDLSEWHSSAVDLFILRLPYAISSDPGLKVFAQNAFAQLLVPPVY